MGTTLVLCGAVAGWCVMVLISRRRLALLRVRCADAEAENTRWRQAHAGQVRKPAEGKVPLRDLADTPQQRKPEPVPPGEWFDAFRAGRPESQDGGGNHDGHDGPQNGNHDGERGAAS